MGRFYCFLLALSGQITLLTFSLSFHEYAGLGVPLQTPTNRPPPKQVPRRLPAVESACLASGLRGFHLSFERIGLAD